jgi:CHAD domain-containing protein
LTLRRRTGGEDAGWHLKLPAAAGARTEVGVDLEPGNTEPLTAAVPAGLAELVHGAARGRPLRPVARIRNRRTVRRLLDGAGTPLVEVADDQVTATRISYPDRAPGDVGGTESDARRWRELEVEVLAGNRDHLAAAVAHLRGAGATPASSASKLGRALGASAASPKRPRTAGSTVVAAGSRLRDALISSDLALREGAAAAVPEARTAARRLRSLLGTYRSLFTSGSTRQLRTDLQAFGAVLGDARNLQMLRRRLAGQLIDEPTEYATAAQARIEQELGAAEPAAVAVISEYLRSDEYLELLRNLDAFLVDPPYSGRGGKGPATLAVPLRTAWSELIASVDSTTADADAPDEAGFHAVRTATKALRYATESAAPALGEDAVSFAAALEEVQEVLGEREDSLTSAAWLAELALHPDTDGVAGFVFGRLHAFEQAVALGALDDFADAWHRVADGELAGAAFGR